MTNNPTIDGVCKTCLGSGKEYDGAAHTCTACNGIGGAPAVDTQQPDAIIEGCMTAVGITHVIYASTVALKDKEQVRLYREPPEVAALQSTIAQLEDKLNKAIDLDFQRCETIARLQARVQELESGRGEPVAWRGINSLGEVVTEWIDGSPPEKLFDMCGNEDYYDSVELSYLAPPAPVAQKLGEPTAYLRNEGVPNNLVVCAFDHPDAFKVFRVPPAPVSVPVDLRKMLNDVWLFLDGQAELNGCVWGEKPEGRHAYWWRKELRAVIEDVNACLDATAALNTTK